MWEFDCKESWARKNWCFWTMLLEKTLESPSDCKEIQPIHPKGNQSWIFIGRTDAEAETPVLWLPDVKDWLIGKDLNAGQDWRQEEKRTTELEMAGWHHRLNGHGLSKLQELVMDREAWSAAVHGVVELETTKRLNWTGLHIYNSAYFPCFFSSAGSLTLELHWKPWCTWIQVVWRALLQRKLPKCVAKASTSWLALPKGLFGKVSGFYHFPWFD